MKGSRQKKILSLLNKKNYRTIKDLSDLLNVSEMTIRRDVNELSRKELLSREHGGISQRQDINKILTTNEKLDRYVNEKEYIGNKMNEIINKEHVIFIGAGTTSLHAIKKLDKNYKSLLTNSLISFNWLLENNFPNIFLTGGELFEETGEFFGLHAEKLLDDFNIDVAFLATNGIFNNNITTSKPTLGMIQQKAIATSKKSIIIADNSKFNKSDPYTFSTLDEVDAVITDNNISKKVKNKYNELTTIIN